MPLRSNEGHGGSLPRRPWKRASRGETLTDSNPVCQTSSAPLATGTGNVGMTPKTFDEALRLFGLSEPLTREDLEAKRRELLAVWDPPRYATLTNNPRKYMQMYKKGEVMTQEIREAYALRSERLQDEPDAKDRDQSRPT